MNISHKTQAALQFVAPTTMIYMAFGTFTISGHWPTWVDIKESSLAFAGIGIAAMLIQDLIPKPMKEFFVFWRFKERLPGHRAFSVIAFKNSNINPSRIKNIDNLKNYSPIDQQIEFYKLYNFLRDLKSVSHLSQRYISWRDTSAVLFLMAVSSIPLVASLDTSKAFSAGVPLSLTALTFHILTALAARASANSLTILVLSLQASEEYPNGN